MSIFEEDEAAAQVTEAGLSNGVRFVWLGLMDQVWGTDHGINPHVSCDLVSTSTTCKQENLNRSS